MSEEVASAPASASACEALVSKAVEASVSKTVEAHVSKAVEALVSKAVEAHVSKAVSEDVLVGGPENSGWSICENGCMVSGWKIWSVRGDSLVSGSAVWFVYCKISLVRELFYDGWVEN